ncbi:hypothetical protein F0562_016255 [Nyssa sinensis]|uniref:UVR domain-containing protein n=1 Tax=Nyssa sinensis TaxID=561372 RepID=A0A5J4ZPI3_9ASTE|nr:hypothetical protein F0562_016255 [Nyssa sinensis]
MKDSELLPLSKTGLFTVCDSLASTMEISNFYASSMKPRLNRPMFFFHNGTVSDIKELSSLPCSFINRFGGLRHLSLPSMKQYNLVLARSFGRENEIQVLSDQQRFNLQTGKHTPLGRTSSAYSLRPCQVKREDSEGTLSGENILLNEQALEQELQFAIEVENYAEAAKIRDSLRVLQEDIKASVLAANARFYNSFRNGDVAAMQALWAKGEHVCVVHPGVSGISGYDLIMGSWEFVWADYEFPLEIEIKDVQVHVRGDIGFLVKKGKGMDALDALNQMKMNRIKPDVVCYTMVLDGVIAEGKYTMVDELFDEMIVLGLVPDIYTYNVYINGLCKQNKVEDGIKMLVCMEELGCKPDLITFNTLLEGFCRVGQLSRARGLVREMELKGIQLNSLTYEIMIDGLVRVGDFDEACCLLRKMLDMCLVPQSSTYDELICGLCRSGLVCNALELLKDIVGKNVAPGFGAWEALLLGSGIKPGFKEIALMNSANQIQTEFLELPVH